MATNKKYSEYKAFQYLEMGIDYKEFKLRKGIIDEWAYKVLLCKTEEERFEEIIGRNIVIDLHAHPVTACTHVLEHTFDLGCSANNSEYRSLGGLTEVI